MSHFLQKSYQETIFAHKIEKSRVSNLKDQRNIVLEFLKYCYCYCNFQKMILLLHIAIATSSSVAYFLVQNGHFSLNFYKNFPF